MSLTLPAEINSEKNKKGNSPILLVEFADLNYHIASRAYNLSVGSGSDADSSGGSAVLEAASATFQTWNMKPGDIIHVNGADREILTVDAEDQVTLTADPGTFTGEAWEAFVVYSDLLQHGTKLNMQFALPQLLNSISSVPSVTLTLLDWRGTLRADIIGTLPDLTGSTINIYIKYNTSTDLSSNAIQIFSGTLTNYSVKRDTMVLSLKLFRPELSMLPANLIPNSNDIGKPLQYGDFNYSDDPRWWGDKNAYYAICPLVFWDADNLSALYWIADHEMNAVPSDLTLIQNSQAFVVRDNKYLHAVFPSAASITNAASGAYVEAVIGLGTPTVGVKTYLHLSPTDTTGSTAANPANAIDGKVSTLAYLEAPTPKLQVQVFGFDELRECTLQGDQPTVQIYFGTISGGGTGTVVIDDGVNNGSTNIDNTYANGWHGFPFPSYGSLDEIEGFWIEVNLGTLTDIEVKNILVRVRMQDASDNDEYLYLRCKGREYSSTWDSRKTTGNLIQYAPDIVESLFRDEWSITDIDTDTFDAVYTYFSSTISVKSCGTIFQQQDGERLLEEICEMMNFAISFMRTRSQLHSTDVRNKWRLVYPFKNVFALSGTSTPGNEDIFTDSESYSGNSHTQQPIKLGTFLLRRTAESENYGKLTVKYVRTHQGYRESVNVGSGKEKILENWLIDGTLASPGNFRNDIDAWLTQKWIAEFETFYNGLAHEPGDILNIRHDDLNDDMLNMTVNTQKWIIREVVQSWRPNTILIEAIELK